MFIHGRLFLTHHSIMLDEVRSLLQKALRRKEWVLALQATKELLSYEKDQLPWKAIVTYLFEDHCLSDTDVLMTIYKATQEKIENTKFKCIETLMQCKTCRIAACLPVAALDAPYEPKKWDSSHEVDDEIKGLVTQKDGFINVDLLLAHLLDAWKEKNYDKIITYMKLATMVVDHEKREITSKGRAYLINAQIKKPNFGQIVLSAMYKNTEDASMRGYLAACHRLTTVPEVCIRLILFAPVARLMFSKYISGLPEKKSGRIDWKTVRRLTYMPDWAVDKHTFRGKFGKASKCILKKKPEGMTESEYEEFHGDRKKKDINCFFEEGVKCTKEATKDNPFWERTKEIYLSHPQKKQKTHEMTLIYYAKLKAKYPDIFKAGRPITFKRVSSTNGLDGFPDDFSESGSLFGPLKKVKNDSLSGQSLIDRFLQKPDDIIPFDSESTLLEVKEHKRSKEKHKSHENKMKNNKKFQKLNETNKREKEKDRTSITIKTELKSETGTKISISNVLPKNISPKDNSGVKLSTPDLYRIETKQLLDNAFEMETLSRARKRRMQESARRLSEYATECSEYKRVKSKGNKTEKQDTDDSLSSPPSRLSITKNSSNGTLLDDFFSSGDDSGFINPDTNFEREESPFSSSPMKPSSSQSRRDSLRDFSSFPVIPKDKRNRTESHNSHSENIFEGLENEFAVDLDESDFNTSHENDSMENITEEIDFKEDVDNDEEEEDESEDWEEVEEADEVGEEQMLALRGPLLQIPTSSHKTYTVADMDIERVVKGPYKDKSKLHRAMFLHQSMKDVIGDPHTLDFEPDGDYLTFPLLRGMDASMEVTHRDFNDCITNAEVEGAEFLSRESLGLIQLHKLKPAQIIKLPASIWAHFMFRFSLEVGDSGLFNALTDKDMTFVYGIDMEDHRGEFKSDQANKEEDLIKLMFTKTPKRELCDAIRASMVLKKSELFRLVCKQINYAQLDRLAREYSVNYQRLVFIERIKMCRKAVAKLKVVKDS